MLWTRLWKHLPLCAVLGIAACSSSTDPHEGGFFGGINGLASGAYEQRRASKQKELSGLQYQQATLQEDADQASARRQQLDDSIEALKRDANLLDTRMRQLKKKLNEALRSRQLAAQDHNKLSGDLDHMQQSLALTSNDPSANKEQMEKAIAALKRRYETLQDTLNKAMQQ